MISLEIYCKFLDISRSIWRPVSINTNHFVCDYILTRTLRRISEIKVFEIVTKPRERKGPDNNGCDGNTCLWTATFLTMVVLEQCLNERVQHVLYGVDS